jgi:hypothetical protein
MGDHYIPRYYLRGFSQDSGMQVWAYDKEADQPFFSHVSKIAVTVQAASVTSSSRGNRDGAD